MKRVISIMIVFVLVIMLAVMLAGCVKGYPNPGNPNNYPIPGQPKESSMGSMKIIILSDPTQEPWSFAPWDK